MSVTRRTTVITPAETRTLATLEAFKQAPLLKDNQFDDLIKRLLKTASSTFERKCNRVFARETVQDVFMVDRGPSGADSASAATLPLSRFPVVSVTSLTVGNAGSAPAPLDPSLYSIDAGTGILSKLSANGNGTFANVTWQAGTVTVQYEAGYLLPGDNDRDLPDDIEDAVITLARMKFKSKDRDPALRSQSAGELGGNQSFWLGTPPEVQDTIDLYRTRKVG